MKLNEKQKNCPFCHDFSWRRQLALIKMPDLEVKLQGANIHCDNERGCYLIDFPISYCPVCGRKLNGE